MFVLRQFALFFSFSFLLQTRGKYEKYGIPPLVHQWEYILLLSLSSTFSLSATDTDMEIEDLRAIGSSTVS